MDDETKEVEKVEETTEAKEEVVEKTEQTESEKEDKPVKTFTQEEVNAINKKAKERLLRSMGFDSEEAYKKHVTEEAEKKPLEEKLKAKDGELNETLSRAEVAEAKLSILEHGVPKTKIDRVLKLSKTYDGESVDAKIEAVLKDFPEFKTSGTPAFGNSVSNGGQTKESQLEKIFENALTGK